MKSAGRHLELIASGPRQSPLQAGRAGRRRRQWGMLAPPLSLPFWCPVVLLGYSRALHNLVPPHSSLSRNIQRVQRHFLPIIDLPPIPEYQTMTDGTRVIIHIAPPLRYVDTGRAACSARCSVLSRWFSFRKK